MQRKDDISRFGCALFVTFWLYFVLVIVHHLWPAWAPWLIHLLQ